MDMYRTKMNLAETFDSPLDPSRSIQLNNRHWPAEKYTHLHLLQDCEASMVNNNIDSKAASFRHLSRLFDNDFLFQKMLRRLGKIRCFNSSFGYLTKDIPIKRALIEQLAYMEERGVSVAPLPSIEKLGELSKIAKNIYLSEYGWDIVVTHKSVRFARPQAERVEEITTYGSMSDFHNDELKGITSIVYLTEVKLENGAFSFIAGSESIPRSSLLTAIHQTVCFDMGLFRPDQMTCIPLEFRCTPLIGNFLDSEKVKILLENLVVFEGPPGKAIVFNGQKLIHRGGKPLAGTRYAAFVAIEGKLIHKARSYISQIRH